MDIGKFNSPSSSFSRVSRYVLTGRRGGDRCGRSLRSYVTRRAFFSVRISIGTKEFLASFLRIRAIRNSTRNGHTTIYNPRRRLLHVFTLSSLSRCSLGIRHPRYIARYFSLFYSVRSLKSLYGGAIDEERNGYTKF